MECDMVADLLNTPCRRHSSTYNNQI